MTRLHSESARVPLLQFQPDQFVRSIAGWLNELCSGAGNTDNSRGVWRQRHIEGELIFLPPPRRLDAASNGVIAGFGPAQIAGGPGSNENVSESRLREVGSDPGKIAIKPFHDLAKHKM